MTEKLRAPVRHIPYQFRVLVFSAILVALAGLLVGLPVYGSLVAAKWGDTSAVTAVNMPRELSSQLEDLVTGVGGEMDLLQKPSSTASQASFVWLKVTIQDCDILGVRAMIDVEVISAGNYSDPRQPAALMLPNNTQLVLQSGNIIQTYTSGAVPGSFPVTVPLGVERPLLFYPFDAYSANLVISLSLEQVVQCPENATGPTNLQSVQTGSGAVMKAVCNNPHGASTSAPPLPLIVGVTNQVDTMHVPLNIASFRELMSGPDAAAKPESGPITIYLHARGHHTPFVQAYVVVLTLMCVGIGLYLLVAALDQAFIRPRPLNPTFINCFAAALFSIPRIRLMLPGNVPAGILVDIYGFGWATLMTGCALLIMISLYVGQYSHKGKLFHFEKKTN